MTIRTAGRLEGDDEVSGTRVRELAGSVVSVHSRFFRLSFWSRLTVYPRGANRSRGLVQYVPRHPRG